MSGMSPRDEERLARYRSGRMDRPERAAFERDCVVNDELAEALYREELLDSVGRQPAGAGGARAVVAMRPWVRAALSVAASVAVFVGVWKWSVAPAPPDDLTRGGAAGAVPLQPIGEVDSTPSRFVWSPDEGAVTYRVDVFTRDGERLGTVVTADTVASWSALFLPDGLGAAAWRVTPLGEDGLERPAKPRVQFTVLKP